MATKKNVKLLLVENVENLGIVGDVVKVKAGYARNYLMPHGLAAQPTPGNMKAVEARRAEVERELRELRQKQEALLARLEGFELTVQRSHNDEGVLYGSVTQHDIVVALHAEGYDLLTERDVRIGAPIKHLDSYQIPIQLASDLKTEIKLWVVSDRPQDKLAAPGQEAQPAEAGAEEA